MSAAVYFAMDTLSLTIHASVDAVTFTVQPVGQSGTSVIQSLLSFLVQPVIDGSTAMVEMVVDVGTSLVEPVVDGSASLVQPLIYISTPLVQSLVDHVAAMIKPVLDVLAQTIRQGGGCGDCDQKTENSRNHFLQHVPLLFKAFSCC
jgi:hypothetical protein